MTSLRTMNQIKLPISMEDTELFPGGGKYGINNHPNFHPGVFEEMIQKLDKVWWSRLVTAVRGYLVNDFKDDDTLVFTFDDSFIHIHRSLVEGTRDDALTCLQDIEILEREGTDSLQALQDGYGLPEHSDPFKKPKTRQSFIRLFGPSSGETYCRAFKQGFCYMVFFSIFCKLQSRWREQKGKVKSVTFQEDAEWQPDGRVVIFQQFRQGNRTWVLTDFDRHLIFYWRPKGVNVIFGDRYVQLKVQEGYRLCSYCGLLESNRDEFMACPRCTAQHHSPPAYYCSKSCQDLHWPKHKANHRI